MTKLTKFDNKQVLSNIRADINAALNSVQEKYGIRLSLGNISYNQSSFRATLSADIIDASAPEIEGNIKWQQNFKRYAFGLKPTDLGREFNVGGRKYKVVGAMSSKANAGEIIVKAENSKNFQRFNASQVISLLSAGK